MYQASNPLNGAVPSNLVALRFGPFELDVRSGEMKRHGSGVRIQPQPFKVLVLLANRPGDVVTREEIQAEVWPAGTFVDFEQSLNFCIRQIRAALGDNALAPRYIETLPRRGYRWVGGPVERVTSGARLREWPRPLAADAARPADGVEEAPAEGVDPDSVLPAPVDVLAETPARGVPAPVLSTSRVVTAAVPRGARAAGPAAARGRRDRPRSRGRRPRREARLARAGAGRAAHVPAPHLPPRARQLGAVRAGRAGRLLRRVGRPARPRCTSRAPTRVTSGPRTSPTRGSSRVSSSGEVAFLRDGVLSRAPLAGGPPKDVLKGVLAADWTPDGADFAIARMVDGRLQLEFPVGHAIGPVLRTSRLRVSPDGRYLALTQHPQPDDDRGGVVVFDRSGRKVAACDGWGSLEGLAWRGDEVWFTATRVGADSSLHALSLDGRERTVLSGMGRLVLHDAAADGRLLLERANLRLEMLLEREGQPEAVDLSWLDFSSATSISADGSTVLFYESGQGGGPDYTTFVRRTDGSLPVRVGTGRALGLSPDGQWMLSIPLREPDRVDVVPVGPGEPRQVRIAGAAAHETAGFVGDGRTIFVSTRDQAGKRATWLVGADGSNPRRLATPEGRSLSMNTFSPDGSRFLMSCPDAERTCVFRVDGGAPVAGRRDARELVACRLGRPRPPLLPRDDEARAGEAVAARSRDRARPGPRRDRTERPRRGAGHPRRRRVARRTRVGVQRSAPALRPARRVERPLTLLSSAPAHPRA